MTLPFGQQPPHLLTAIPGPASMVAVDALARHECPAITARRARRAAALGTADDDPFVWDAARGANVRDVDGNVFVDLTAGFAVALLGHGHPKVVEAVQQQSARLLHAMGDAWPDQARVRLLTTLTALAPEGLERAILGLSGSDAIDAAVKTAVLATGRHGVVVFERGYHGLALGVLGLQAYKPAFTEPFARITHGHVTVLPWGCDADAVAAALTPDVGLVLVEPLQGRGGMREAPAGWLATLRDATTASGALLAFDEIQCGLGRTGTMWACEHDGVVPDLLCTGKALAGGLPLSACIGTAAAMDAWGASQGEALHTQTFLGHPLGCAAALAVLDVIASDDISRACANVGADLMYHMRGRGHRVTGRGLMIGVDLGAPAFPVCRALQRRGYIALPAGPGPGVLALTPPVSITDEQVAGFLAALDASIDEVGP